MNPNPNDPQEHIKRLDELQDLMLKAGLIVGHAHTKQANAAVFTQRGLMVLESIRILDSIGKLDNRDKLYLWEFLSYIAKHRPPVG